MLHTWPALICIMCLAASVKMSIFFFFFFFFNCRVDSSLIAIEELPCKNEKHTYLFEKQGVVHVLGIHRGEPVLVLRGDIYLVASQDVADGTELLDFSLKHLLQPLVPELRALHLLT